jgi:IMP dehydrogenase/GMP reductase
MNDIITLLKDNTTNIYRSNCANDCNCATLEKMRTDATFVQVTSAGMVESHVHDVSITKEAPNYHQ